MIPRFLEPEAISSLDPSMMVVFLDRHRCPFSRSLYDEMTVTSMKQSPHKLWYVDIGMTPPEDLRGTWLPGVPCLVSDGEVYLGVDAFAKCREMLRSVEGADVQPLQDA